jgi:hypothetical protein
VGLSELLHAAFSPAREAQTAEKQPTNPHTSSLGPLPQMNRFSAPSPSKSTRLHGGRRKRRKGVK